MSPSLKRRTFGAFLLAVALALPSAEAAPRQAAADRTLAGALWNLLSMAWTKAGCILDPDGAPGSGKAGCILDPNGVNGSDSILPPGGAKEGCLIDPSGATGPACATPPETTDEGCLIDPNGSCVSSPGIQARS